VDSSHKNTADRLPIIYFVNLLSRAAIFNAYHRNYISAVNILSLDMLWQSNAYQSQILFTAIKTKFSAHQLMEETSHVHVNATEAPLFG